MTIAETAMRDRVTRTVTTLTELLRHAEQCAESSFARGQAGGLRLALEAVREELGDYLSDDPTKIDLALDEIAAHAKDCMATPDPDADGPEAWVDARHQVAAASAYRHSARIVREAVA